MSFMNLTDLGGDWTHHLKQRKKSLKKRDWCGNNYCGNILTSCYKISGSQFKKKTFYKNFQKEK